MDCVLCSGEVTPQALADPAHLCRAHELSLHVGVVIQDPRAALVETAANLARELERSGAKQQQRLGLVAIARMREDELRPDVRADCALSVLQSQVFSTSPDARIQLAATTEAQTAIADMRRMKKLGDQDDAVLTALEARSRRLSATALHQRGQYDLASAMYEQSLDAMHARGLRDTAEQVRQRALWSAALFLDGEVKRSKTMAERAAEEVTFHSADDVDYFIRAKVVEHHLAQGEYDKALEKSTDLLEKMSDLALPISRVIAERDHATALIESGDYDAGLSAALRAMGEAREHHLTDQEKKVEQLMKRAEGSRSGRHTDAERVPDYLVVTIRPDELMAALHHIGGEADGWEDEVLWAKRVVRTDVGDEKRVTVLATGSQGISRAQDVVTRAIERLRPRQVLLVGIAGAVPTSDIALGDVLLPREVIDFSVEAAEHGGDREYSLTAASGLDPFADSAGPMLAAWESSLKPWPRITLDGSGVVLPKPPTPLPEEATVIGNAAWKQRVLRSLSHHHESGRAVAAPRAVSGPLASSNTLVKDPEIAAKWLSTARHLLGVEMESAGVIRSSASAGVPCLVIRGISDIVGLQRDERWTAYAAASAGCFAGSLIRSGLWGQ